MQLLSWLFGKHASEKKVERVELEVKQSLHSVKSDLHNVNRWLLHFKERHGEHDKKFEAILRRLDHIEVRLAEISEGQASFEDEEEEEEAHGKADDEEMPDGDSKWELLTDTQKNICWKLASLQKENPDQWISLKFLAQEIYPDKDYAQVRSALSQFVSQLEELGYVKRKRKGKQAYVYSTKNNPYCNTTKKPLIAEAKAKVRHR